MRPLPCPNCGSELAFLDQYHRHYCYSCGMYAPEGFGDRDAKICPTCGGILAYVTQYDRYYCYRCGAYPPDDAVLRSLPDPTVMPAAAGVPTGTAVVVVEPAKPEEPKPAPVETPAESPGQPEERAEEELPPDEQLAAEETPTVLEKPPLVREEILAAKKPALMDLCKAYDLDPTGTKEQLRERLLSYVDELEGEAQPEEIAEANRVEPESAPEEAASESPATPAEEPATEPGMEETSVEETPLESTPAEAPAVVEVPTRSEPAVETVTVPPVVVPDLQPFPTETYAAPAAAALHPCPTCGRELSYIAQYDRWYCYRCRAYAPIAKSRFACPSCGAALRWIDQYGRWWCDAERRYAPADLPRPESAIPTEVAPAVVERAAPRTATVAATMLLHRHRNPGSGIGLVGFGVLLFMLYEFLVDLPGALSINTGVVLAPDVAFGLRFFAFVFVAVGAILGLSAVRDRR